MSNKKSNDIFLLDKWNDFIAAWAEAVRAYRTPVSFVKGSRAKEVKVEFNGREYPFICPYTPGYAERQELMVRQKAEAEERKKGGKEPRWKNDGADCFLCDNVGQAIAAQTTPDIPNNIMYDLGDYIIAPNRYPAFLGHSLFIPKNHDNTKSRIEPKKDEKGKIIGYPLKKGKTAGALMTPDYLESLVKTCDDYHIIGLNNHVRDAMSVPGHKHFHLFPEDLMLFSLIDFVLDGKKQTNYGETIYKLENTPFDTLVINKKDKNDYFMEKACSILKKIEKDNQVFTLVYHNKNLFISPRHNIEEGKRIQIGAGVPIHFFNEGIEFFEKVKKFVPIREEYNWDKFF